MYTGPGFLGALLGVVNVVLLAFFFREAKLIDRKAQKKAKKLIGRKKLMDKYESAEGNYEVPASPSPPPPPREEKQRWFDVFAATASIIIFFVILSGFSLFET